jgi:hypothetical protein
MSRDLAREGFCVGSRMAECSRSNVTISPASYLTGQPCWPFLERSIGCEFLGLAILQQQISLQQLAGMLAVMSTSVGAVLVSAKASQRISA